MEKRRGTYRTKDGQADYTFSFEQQSDGSWHIYIESQPSYGTRSASCQDTHRIPDGTRFHVCWSLPLTNYKNAKFVAALWADCTQHYIRTGQFVEPSAI